METYITYHKSLIQSETKLEITKTIITESNELETMEIFNLNDNLINHYNPTDKLEQILAFHMFSVGDDFKCEPILNPWRSKEYINCFPILQYQLIDLQHETC